jgi:hypothetical protein
LTVTIRTKTEAAKRLAQLNERSAELSSNHNCRRLIPTLLCLDDSVSNLMKDVSRNHRLNNDFDEMPDLYVSYMEFLLQWHYVIDDILNEILKNGFDDPTTKIDFPNLTFGIYTEKLSQQDLRTNYLQVKDDLRYEGKIPKDSRLLLEREADFLPNEGKANGYYYFFVNSNISKKTIKDFGLIFTLRDLYVQKAWLSAMIYKFPVGVEAEFKDEGLGPIKILYPKGFDHANKRHRNGLSTRFLDTNFGVFDWNSDLREISKNHLRTDLLIGKDNLVDLRIEWQEIAKGLFKIKGFPDAFHNMYGIAFDTFISIVVELLTICYKSNGHMVGIWSRSDFINGKLLNARFSAEEKAKLIDVLLNNEKIRKIKTHFILPYGNLIFTNFRRLQEALVGFPQICFEEAYEEGLKGPVFEEACRNSLRKKGFKTLPNCVKINEPIIPKDISIKLWHREKPNTDLDVVASNGNNIILLECKEIKSILIRETQNNQFRKYTEELFWRSKWIASNLARFKEYVGQAWEILQINPKEPVTVLPLVVSNNLVEIEKEGYPPIITSNELNDLLSVDIFPELCNEVNTVIFPVGTKKVPLIYIQGNYR